MSLNSAEFARAYQCRSEMRLPIRICEMLDYQQLRIKQQFSPKKHSISSLCRSTKKKKRHLVDDQFVSAFSHMTLEEKNRLYVKSVEYLKLIFQRTEPRIVIENDSFSKVLIESGIFGSKWVEVNLRLNAELCTIEIRGKMQAVIDLHEYLIRRSSDWRKHAFVLEAIKPGFTEAFRFGFNNQVSCEKCYQAISNLVDKCIFQAYRKQVHGLKQFKLDFEDGDQNNNKLVASKQRDNRVEEMDNLLASYIQQELKEFCLSCGELTLDEFSQKFQILNPSNNLVCQYQTFPSEYSEEALYNDSNYLPTKEYPEMLYQLKADPGVLRLNKMYECSIEEIINALSDTQCFERWNQQVKTATVISYIKEANSIVVSEVHKPLVKYYEPRVFSYLRTLFRKGDAVYIVDKPLTCKKEYGSSREKEFDHFVKGIEVFEVWKLVSKSNGRTFVDVITKLDHKMIKNKEIEIRLTGIYMEGLLHLDQYLQHNAQRAVNIFNLRYKLEDYKKSNKRMFKREEIPVRMLESYILSRNQADIKPHYPTTTVRIEDDSFYSAAGESDWNSKAVSVFGKKSATKNFQIDENHRNPSRKVSFVQNNPIFELPSSINVSNESKQEKSYIIKKKESQKQNVQSTHQSRKILNQSSHLIFNKTENDNNPEKVGTKQEQKQAQKSQIESGSNLSVQSIKDDDQYQYHICQKILPQQTKEGLTIIPQHHLNPARPYPMKPKQSYPWKNLTDKEWSHYFLKNLWQITPLGQFKCINQKLIDNQSGVLKLVLKRVAANLMSGKGINFSLPVEVFDNKSNLEILARGLCFAPKFLQRAAQTKDPLQRLKFAMCFHLGMIISYMQMSKPFDPILGETYQCWINGCPYYGEQVCHHPSTSSYYFVGRGFKIYGSITPQVQISLNTAVGYNKGMCTIQFDDNPEHKIYLVSPGGQIVGVTYGERKLIFTNKGFCFDTMGYYCEMQYNPYKKSIFSFGKQTKEVDILQSKIYKMDKIHTIEFRKKFTKSGVDKGLLQNPVSTVSGRMTQELRFDGVVYFDVRKDEPCLYEQQAYPLASNSNYREDIIFKTHDNQDLAQQHKHRLEQIQRRDKRLRLKQQK